MLKITLRKSPIGYNQTQKRTVRALGLRRMHQSVQQPENPSIRGMIARIAHLVEVEVISKQEDSSNANPRVKTRSRQQKAT